MIVILRLDAKLFACRKRQRKSIFTLFLSSIKSSVRFFSSSSSSLWSWKASKALAFWSLQAWLRSQSHSNSRFYTLQALISIQLFQNRASGARILHQPAYQCTTTTVPVLKTTLAPSLPQFCVQTQYNYYYMQQDLSFHERQLKNLNSIASSAILINI